MDKSTRKKKGRLSPSSGPRTTAAGSPLSGAGAEASLRIFNNKIRFHGRV